MIKKICFFLILFGMMSPCFAQDVDVPSQEGASVQMPDAAQTFIELTEAMLGVARAHEGNCPEMAAALQSLIQQNGEFLRSLDYATQQADEKIIRQAHENAQTLGTLLGACHDDKNIEKLLSAWLAL